MEGYKTPLPSAVGAVTYVESKVRIPSKSLSKARSIYPLVIVLVVALIPGAVIAEIGKR
jgi:hypothetical protein